MIVFALQQETIRWETAFLARVGLAVRDQEHLL
jgi:hypothetical protein